MIIDKEKVMITKLNKLNYNAFVNIMHSVILDQVVHYIH